ncbi:S1 RNA-binding domain-containing protein [Lagierella sp.]|uniref:S1 RNA-binding domain-containing protein n=1 Tax=Lagierella sp. TaxID=2849657 RepID=UPI00261089EB|nr:S1 RNA-binding domain-containing protein [Lagierella sp.]
MSISVGQILEGKVTGITKFGAFVSFPEGENGLVHISEISDEYVEKIEDFLKKDDIVKVKVLSIKDGKVSLSIKQAKKKSSKPEEIQWDNSSADKDLSFEDKMSKFLKESNEKYVEMRTRDNKRKQGNRRSKSY